MSYHASSSRGATGEPADVAASASVSVSVSVSVGAYTAEAPPFSGAYVPEPLDDGEMPTMEVAGNKKKKKGPPKGAKVHVGKADDVFDDAEDAYEEEEEEYSIPARVSADAALAARSGIKMEMDVGPLLAGSSVGLGRSGHNPLKTLDTDAPARLALPEYKQRVVPILKEFLLEEDFEEARRCLEELDTPFFGYEFVRRALTMAMEASDRERELVSRLLSFVYGTDITMEQIGKGFERLFEVIDDLKLDVPEARTLAAKFLARAVADEIIPPAYLNDPYVASLAGDIVDQAKALLSMKHASARLEHVWHVTGVFTVPELKQSIRTTLEEFMVEHDKEEVLRCVKELHVPHFGHEVVYRASVLTLSHWPNAEVVERTEKLISYLKEQEAISESQIVKAFQRLYANVPDLSLDVPQAKQAVDAMFRHLSNAGTLNTRSVSMITPRAAGAASGMDGTPKASASAAK